MCLMWGWNSFEKINEKSKSIIIYISVLRCWRYTGAKRIKIQNKIIRYGGKTQNQWKFIIIAKQRSLK